MTDEGMLLYRISLLGPSRVGKTSLITAILKDSQKLLSGTVISIHPHNTETERRIARNKHELDGSLLAGEFNPGALRGTEEAYTFELEIDPGVPSVGIRLDLLDYPGGWLDPERRHGHEREWGECKEWIKECTVILVPIDAAVLMESTTAPERTASLCALTVDSVTSIATEWAKERRLRLEEPALLLLCPVKCETYFADNGGSRNDEEELFQRVSEVYRSLIESVGKEAGHVRIIYSPVDTIGCVEIMDAKWEKRRSTPPGLEFGANYRVRPPARQQVKGSDSVLISLCRNLIEARKKAEAKAATEKWSEAEQAKHYAAKSEGFFRNIWMWFSGEREDRRGQAGIKVDQAQAAETRVIDLQNVIERLANRAPGMRVRELPKVWHQSS